MTVAFARSATPHASEADAARAEIAGLEAAVQRADGAATEAASAFDSDPTDASVTASLVAAKRAEKARAALTAAQERHEPVFLEETRKAMRTRLDSLSDACSSAAVQSERDAAIAAIRDFEVEIAARVSALLAAIAATNAARAEASSLSQSLGLPGLYSPESEQTNIEAVRNAVSRRSAHETNGAFLGVAATNRGHSIHFQTDMEVSK